VSPGCIKLHDPSTGLFSARFYDTLYTGVPVFNFLAGRAAALRTSFVVFLFLPRKCHYGAETEAMTASFFIL
jgi:hypothetical protein